MIGRAIPVIAFLLFAGVVHAQGTDKGTQGQLEGVNEELPEEGTYQIVVDDERVRVELSEELLREVSERRAEDSVVFIQVNEYARVKVLPFNQIQREGFTPIEKYRYEED